MKLKSTFIEGKMNMDIDERLLPEGQYPYARDIRIGNTDASDIGALETVIGNKLVEDLELTNAKCIGVHKDEAIRALYWFVTSDEKDLLMEYNEAQGSTTVILETSNQPSKGILNFSKNNLITGINKVINGEPNKDLLFWTDDLNPPRFVNIERAKGYGADGFVEDDISVIKKPPFKAMDTTLQNTVNSENFLVDKFVSFAYRYKYLDDEFSALSPFTSYQFFPKKYRLNYQTLENEGMENTFNQVLLEFNTGSERVTDIQLAFRESNKTEVYIIETFNKEDEGWADDATESYTFNNSKKYDILPSDELSRIFDNVPRLSKAQEFVGNRLVYGNYLEGYNLEDDTGNKVVLDYDLELQSNNIAYNSLGYDLGAVNKSTDLLAIDTFGVPLTEGLVINFNITMERSGASFIYNYSYVLPEDYVDAAQLVATDEFIYFVEEVMTSAFSNNVQDDVPVGTTDVSYTGFEIYTGLDFQIPILAPYITYTINNGDDPDVIHYWDFVDVATEISYSEAGSNRSLKSNRSYEVGMVYMDVYSRSSTVLTKTNNTVLVAPELSTSQNLISVKVNHKPPVWASRYKFVIKQNKGDYETIYINRFYTDGVYRWLKLEGDNKDKVKGGDILILKSDLTGVTNKLVEVKVLEVTTQSTDFLTPNYEGTEEAIQEEAGVYMKIKPDGFTINEGDAEQESYQDSDAPQVGGADAQIRLSREADRSLGGFEDPDNLGNFIDYEHKAGTRVSFDLEIESREAEGAGVKTTYQKEFVSQQDYANFVDWYNTEVVDFGFDFESKLDPAVNRFTNSGAANKREMWLQTKDVDFPRIIGQIDIIYSQGDIVFETKPKDLDDEVFYETGLVFDIENGEHLGNVQNQNLAGQSSGLLVIGEEYTIDSYEFGDDFTNVGGTNVTGNTFVATGTTPTVWSNSSNLVQSAINLLDAFNCYVMGNGVESYKIRDAFNTNSLRMNLRPNQVDPNGYKEIRRYADLTYSEPYNENSSLNGLNEFNISRANFKEDIEKKYGRIQKLYSRDTDVVVFQEDKVSYVLFGKDVLYNTDGTSNLSQINDVLGRQVMYTGEYGISDSPESFTFDAKTLYWTDSKRGAVLKLGGNGIFEISNTGLRTWFKDKFRGTDGLFKIGSFDPYYDQYVLSFVDKGNKNIDNTDSTLTYDERPKGWTSFHSFNPDMMIGMNNDFYSFDNGNLYVHHDPDSCSSNKYYGDIYSSKASVMINQEPSVIKDFQALMLEGSTPWDCNIKAYVTSKGDYIGTSVLISEFSKKEGLWFGYMRRNEDDNALDSKSSYGIGRVVSVDVDQITFSGGNNSLVHGDRLYALINGNLDLIGVVDSVDGDVITLDEEPFESITNGDFLVGRKNARIEGSNLKGYTARVDVTLTPDKKEELFAINIKSAKSSN